MYKSIFERIKNYSSNPVDEYNKIKDFMDEQYVDRGIRLITILKDAYSYCDILNSVFPTLDDFFEQNCSNVSSYQTPAKHYFNKLLDEEKEVLLEEFLTFSQAILTTVRYLNTNIDEIKLKHFITFFNGKIIIQLANLIEISLKCFNYKFVLINNSLKVELIINHPVAEAVADVSSKNISDSIIGFLGSRDVKNKERYLHDFIDYLEPLFVKYKNLPFITKIREYIQLVRHPETKNTEKEYEWFFKNKKKYLDDLFMLCLLVQEYDLSKKTIKDFELNKTKS